jgi:hypothetical protein
VYGRSAQGRLAAVKPGDRKPIWPLSEAVREAAAICDPDGAEAGVRGMLEAYEDDDRPVTAVEDLAGELRGTAEGIDPDADTPAVQMTAAAALWLATNPDQEGEREHVLREAARVWFEGKPPDYVAEWLTAQGVNA